MYHYSAGEFLKVNKEMITQKTKVTNFQGEFSMVNFCVAWVFN
jgi:hypothetical protein